MLDLAQQRCWGLFLLLLVGKLVRISGWVWEHDASALAWTTADKCAADVDTFCSMVRPGEGRLADCLSAQQAAEEKGNVDGCVQTICVVRSA